MGFLDLTLTIQAEKARKNDLTSQITDNSMSLRLRQKQSSSKTAEIYANFNSDAALIKNKMAKIDDKTSAEYEELMQEYKELQDERDAALTMEEQAATDYQTQIDTENDLLEAQRAACEEDIKGFEDARKDDIESEFGYFK